MIDNLKKETDRILEALPGSTNVMIGEFMKLYEVRLITVRIWAEQGVLIVCDGEIYKMAAPARTKEEIEIAVNAIKKLSVFRCGAIFRFDQESFSPDWTNGMWILSFIDIDKDLAFLVQGVIGNCRCMKMEVLYTAWLNGSAIIKGYEE